jgi:co-chaperonin GroES (HSP10)
MNHSVDPKKVILDDMGDISNVKLFNNQVLVAIYLRPEQTSTGVWLPEKNRDEDKYQGKAGLVIKLGPLAFDETNDNFFKDVDVKLHDWIYFKPSDGWSITVHGVLCRILDDSAVRGKIDAPDVVW